MLYIHNLVQSSSSLDLQLGVEQGHPETAVKLIKNEINYNMTRFPDVSTVIILKGLCVSKICEDN